jgi:transcriptional regulator with XRE-family HTH domain
MFQAQSAMPRNYFQRYMGGMATWHERLKEAWEETGWSKAEFARRADVSYDNVVKYLAGRVDKPRGDILVRLSDALGKDDLWLEKGIDIEAPTRKVRLAGYIGAGQAVYPVDDGADDEVDAPADSPASTVAAQIRGDSMLPTFHEGWLIYWSRHKPPMEMVNQLAVVQLSDGRIMVKTIRLGSQPGLFRLTSFNAADIADVPLDWAAPIDWVKPRY